MTTEHVNYLCVGGVEFHIFFASFMKFLLFTPIDLLSWLSMRLYQFITVEGGMDKRR